MSSAKRSELARWLTGDGIELGALHQPLPVPAGVRVSYVDRLGVDDLRAQYPELADADLVPVTHIGTAENLVAIADESVDFVVACHVLEHLEDPTRGLREIHRVLRDGGIFFCALPEPRVTFDRERGMTSVEHLMHDHPAGLTTRVDHFTDWVENVERHQPWWESESPDPQARVQLLLDMDYSIHFHVWRPDTFLDYLAAVRREHGLVFETLAFAGCQPGVDDEFIFILRKGIAALPVAPPAPSPGPALPSLADAVHRTSWWRRRPAAIRRRALRLVTAVALASAAARWVARRRGGGRGHG